MSAPATPTDELREEVERLRLLHSITLELGASLDFDELVPKVFNRVLAALGAEGGSIWIADAVTGKGHEVWHANAGAGSRFYSLEGGSAFAWGADDRIVFPWEETGWVHLYSIPATGGTPPGRRPHRGRTLPRRSQPLRHDGLPTGP